MIVKSSSQWWLLQSFTSKSNTENRRIVNKLKNQPLCSGMFIDYVNDTEFRLIFEWYLRIGKSDWIRVQRTTGIVLDMKEDENHLYIKAIDADYIFEELANE